MFLIRQAALAGAKQMAIVHMESWQDAYKDIVSVDFLTNISLADRTAHRIKQLEKDPSGNREKII